MKTALTQMLGIEVPVAQAPIGGAAVPALAAAVSNAGGLGCLACTGLSGDAARDAVSNTRALTSKPFGANFLLSYEDHIQDALDVVLAEAVPVINLFWGNPAPYVDRVHQAGSVLLMQVGSVEEARRAADAGVDILVAQGWGAGGHVRGEVDMLCLIRGIKEAVDGVPVLGAGGITDGAGLAAVLALGGSGVYVGTRFLASEEASVAREYRECILKGSQSDTVHTTLFDHGWPGAPHRVLQNSTYRAWVAAGKPPREARPGSGDGLAVYAGEYRVQRYESFTATADTHGDIEAVALWAGQGVGLVKTVQPAADIVRDIADGAKLAIEQLANLYGD